MCKQDRVIAGLTGNTCQVNVIIQFIELFIKLLFCLYSHLTPQTVMRFYTHSNEFSNVVVDGKE